MQRHFIWMSVWTDDSDFPIVEYLFATLFTAVLGRAVGDGVVMVGRASDDPRAPKVIRGRCQRVLVYISR
jgi:hypothetical protein